LEKDIRVMIAAERAVKVLAAIVNAPSMDAENGDD
jgi:hypothetical protein